MSEILIKVLALNVFWAGLHRQLYRFILHRVHIGSVYYIVVRFALMRDMSKIDVEGKKRTICQKSGRYFSCTKLVKKVSHH